MRMPRWPGRRRRLGVFLLGHFYSWNSIPESTPVMTRYGDRQSLPCTSGVRLDSDIQQNECARRDMDPCIAKLQT
ncbi:hypothetical protein F5Y19DRAFT_270005 [Xylariaceae sp. FL1651]|nr:hypothetical protein F5Y19DRAFT_270005 [Xylariaceae sp. FL1651]